MTCLRRRPRSFGLGPWQLIVSVGTLTNDPSPVIEGAAGAVGCGTWVAPDRLLFTRFIGEMPPQKKAGVLEIAANATTIAVLGRSSTTFLDRDVTWSVHGTSPDGSSVLITAESPPRSLFVLNNARDLSNAELRPLPQCERCTEMRFAPDGRQLYYLATSPAGAVRVNFRDVLTLKERAGALLRKQSLHVAKWEIKGDYPAMMDPSGRFLALTEESKGGLDQRVVVVDLETGGRTPILDWWSMDSRSSTRLASRLPGGVDFLAWLPAQ